MRIRSNNIATNTLFPKPIDEIIGDCVANVATNITTQLTNANPNIHGISYFFGHPLEIITIIKELSESKTLRYNKFPCVMLFADVLTSPSSVKGLSLDVSLNMVIAMSTQPTIKADKRITNNFEPILRPIWQALVMEIYRSGYFWMQSPRQITHYGIERLYWGRNIISGTDKNSFIDCIDAIEIKGMRLTPTMKSTSAISITAKNWRSIVIYVVDNPSRDVTNPDKVIQVGGGKFVWAEYAPGNSVTPLTTDGANFLAGKMVEYPFFYSDDADSTPDYDDVNGIWNDNTGFSAGAYLTIKVYDNA